jgi:putative flippase GtrA
MFLTIITNPRERARFMRFAVVGVIGTIVDFGTFNLLTFSVGMLAVYAQAISFGCAVVSNFTWNRYWTYPDSRSKKISKQLLQFFVVSVIGLTIRTPIFIFVEAPLTRLFMSMDWIYSVLPFLTPTWLGHNGSLALAVVIVMMWNFFVNRFWTYGDVE